MTEDRSGRVTSDLKTDLSIKGPICMSRLQLQYAGAAIAGDEGDMSPNIPTWYDMLHVLPKFHFR